EPQRRRVAENLYASFSVSSLRLCVSAVEKYQNENYYHCVSLRLLRHYSLTAYCKVKDVNHRNN
ncbi:MAG: hypothetical protein ABH886_05605, partial [Candidatus Desantisbacteria bacterium]